ncbi:zf-HC2 domain-containing protein [Desulfatiglans anilini]|uniref:zf-HC2 domain-containing protein n=1 Tax=Desulfatiglans anilini TaxID=90728 RepID=UPI00041B3D28|nr:zf-HC2 domain-containing protein [Desulfatiglans anilini]
MTCREIQEQLSLYVDHELDAEDEAAVREHLEGCPACREALRDLELCLQAMRDMPRHSAPPGFLEGVSDRLEAGGRWKRRLEGVWELLRSKRPLEVVGVLATAVVVVLAYQVFDGRQKTLLSPPDDAVAPPRAAYERSLELAEAPVAEQVTRVRDAPPLLRLRVVKTVGPEAAGGSAEPGGRADSQAAGDGFERHTREKAARSVGAPEADVAADGLEPLSLAKVREKPPVLSQAALEEKLESAEKKPALSPDALLSAVEAAILGCGGTLIGVEPGPDHPDSRVLSFRVPAERYDALLQELRPLGRLEIQEPAGLARGAGEPWHLELILQP